MVPTGERGAPCVEMEAHVEHPRHVAASDTETSRGPYSVIGVGVSFVSRDGHVVRPEADGERG